MGQQNIFLSIQVYLETNKLGKQKFRHFYISLIMKMFFLLSPSRIYRCTPLWTHTYQMTDISNGNSYLRLNSRGRRDTLPLNFAERKWKSIRRTRLRVHWPTFLFPSEVFFQTRENKRSPSVAKRSAWHITYPEWSTRCHSKREAADTPRRVVPESKR